MAGCSGLRRVLMTADTIGGVWTHALDLAKGLGSFGVEVTLATMGAPLSSDQWLAARHVPNLCVEESRFRLEWMDDPWPDVAEAGEWLMTLERRVSPDIVHLNNYAHGCLPWQAPHLVAGHSCVLSWWQAVKGEPAPRDWERYRQVVASGLRGAEAVVAPTRSMLAELARYYGPLRSPAVIPNGRPAAANCAMVKEDFILAAGRVWDQAKNIGALARAGPAVDWPIYIAGAMRHPSGGSPEFERVQLLGVLSAEDLAKYYARAAIYCLPAKYEPFGLSVLEAAQAGCALVIGDIPSLRENWDGAALFVRPDDPLAVTRALRSLIDDTQRRRVLASQAKKRAESFTVEKMAESYFDLYTRLRERRPVFAAAGS